VEPLTDIYETLGDKFEQHLLSMASKDVHLDYFDSPGYSYPSEGFWVSFSNGLNLSHPYATSSSYLVLIGISKEELEYWKSAFGSDPHFQRVLVKTKNGDNRFSVSAHGKRFDIPWGLEWKFPTLRSQI